MHTNPDVLALLALGEHSGTAEELQHLQECTFCREELADLTLVVDIGRRADTANVLERPRGEVWQAIRGELGFAGAATQPATEPLAVADPDQTIPPGDAAQSAQPPQQAHSAQQVEPPQSARRPHAGRKILALALAAVLALVVGIGIGISINQSSDNGETVIGEADLKALPAYSGAKGRAVVERDAKGNRVLVVTFESTRAIDGARQVWLIDRQVKGMSSLGFVNGGHGTLTIPDSLDLSKFPIVDVSVEPVNDPNPTHSGVSIVRGTLSP